MTRRGAMVGHFHFLEQVGFIAAGLTGTIATAALTIGLIVLSAS